MSSSSSSLPWCCCCCVPPEGSRDERERLVHRGGSRIPTDEQAGYSGDSAEPPPPNRGPVVSARKARPPPPAAASAEALDRHGGEEDRGRALTVRAVGVPDVDSRVTDAAETFANLQAEHMGVTRARHDLCRSACCGTAASQHGLAECLRNLELRHETALKIELKGYNFSLVMKDGGVDMPTSVQEAARLVSELSTRARAFLGMSTRLDEMMAALLRTESTISKEVSETNRDYADNVRAHDNMQRSLAELRRGRKDVARYKEDISSLLLQVAQIAGVMEQPSED
ncbi:uncharacterized protein LOC133344839 [Lethenteron reissneri]|uniref:uncharacterized protein LOC133344839 n=1 Tax=Lethenteron reissneri TaxID=7753 RepID=UPI002AB78BFB|nr:uncharacterized protein LOC133344839 [Lethenteron reissneri]